MGCAATLCTGGSFSLNTFWKMYLRTVIHLQEVNENVLWVSNNSGWPSHWNAPTVQTFGKGLNMMDIV